ncbi:MAG TPA: glycosyltransferase [Verrucomicrobiae bacterium]|nr:glycosyltransferase [Verrucomicrobiae bacterium]
MRILYAATKYESGDPARGPSFEEANFRDALANLGHEIIGFDFVTLHRELGHEAMNRRLWETVRNQQPELVFFCLTREEFDFNTVKRITDSGATITYNWFCDDHWRFDKYSSRWGLAFNWVSTTDSAAPAKYARIGCQRVIKTQWACNLHQYRRLDLPLSHEVNFVGRQYGRRLEAIEKLRQAGIKVGARGEGWPEGRATQEEMIRIFNQSRINLNFTDSPKYINRFKRLLGRKQPPNQIKGRNFEIPGCGGFLLTDHADNLEDYYVPGREIALFESVDDLVDKVRYYLAHDSERAGIAEAGYSRTLREHSYEQRFSEIFARMGLPPAKSRHEL